MWDGESIDPDLLLTSEHIIIRRKRFLNYSKMPHILTDIFGKKLALGTDVYVFGIWDF